MLNVVRTHIQTTHTTIIRTKSNKWPTLKIARLSTSTAITYPTHKHRMGFGCTLYIYIRIKILMWEWFYNNDGRLSFSSVPDAYAVQVYVLSLCEHLELKRCTVPCRIMDDLRFLSINIRLLTQKYCLQYVCVYWTINNAFGGGFRDDGRLKVLNFSPLECEYITRKAIPLHSINFQ